MLRTNDSMHASKEATCNLKNSSLAQELQNNRCPPEIPEHRPYAYRDNEQSRRPRYTIHLKALPLFERTSMITMAQRVGSAGLYGSIK